MSKPDKYTQIPWMPIALSDLEEDWREGNNPKIAQAFIDCGYPGLTDSTAWCGVYVGSRLLRVGIRPPQAPAWARNYSDPDWGIGLADPMYGCVVNVERGEPGGDSHVGFCVDFDDKYVRLLGGNQTNDVTDSYVVPRSKVISYKLPIKES